VGDGRDDGSHANERHQSLAPSHHHQPEHREIFLIVLQSTCFNNPSITFLNSQYILKMMQVTRVSLTRNAVAVPLADEFFPQLKPSIKFFSINHNSIFF
jgi:hypothetical protein